MKFLKVRSERFDQIVIESGLEPLRLIDNAGNHVIGLPMTVNAGIRVVLIRA